MTRQFDRVTMNLVGANKRYEMLDGKKYLVVPTVMLTEGVHTGTAGPLYYPPSELERTPQTCNSRPIVLYHPTMSGGEGISACAPDVIERQGVGTVFNSSYDGRLRSESWLDEDKLRRVDNRVLEALDNNKTVEVSTGLYHDTENTTGEWNGEKYSAIIRNLQLDHLAILPDQKGACSVADGAGLLRNAADHGLSHNDIKDHLHQELNGTPDEYDSPKPYSERSHIQDVFPKHVVYQKGGKLHKHGYKVKDGKAKLDGEPEEVRKQTSYISNSGEAIIRNDGESDNSLPPPSAAELSEPMRRQQMQKALTELYADPKTHDWGGWVTDLFANYVVWSKDGRLFRLPYAYDDDKIKFDGDPEEVEQVQEYRTRRQTPADGTASSYDTNSSGRTVSVPTLATVTKNAISSAADLGKSGDSQDHAKREAAVNKLMGAGGQESDRAWFMKIDDELFEKVSKYVMKGATEPVVPYTYQGVGDRSAVSGNQQVQPPMTVNQYIEQAPAPVRDFLRSSVAEHEQQRQRLVKTITANKSNVFSEQWLNTQGTDVLKGLAAIAGSPHQGQPTANYAGQADVPMFITSNNQQPPTPYEPEALPLPTLNWDDEKRAS